MPNSRISYIIATKDKLPYLQNRLEQLLAFKKEGDEILIADGASTDGTKEYVEGLVKAGKVNFFVSEKDYGVAHALNKLTLASKTEFIKYLTDDDAFHYPTIERCREFLSAHPEIDLVNTEGGIKNQDPLALVRPVRYASNYRVWQQQHTPFSFCDLGFLFRRTSIPAIGLWNLSFRGPDVEFSFRISAGKVNMAWYTGYGWVNISNPQSVSRVFMKKIKNDVDRLNKFYLDINPDPYLIERLKVLRNKIRSRTLFKRNSKTQKEYVADWPLLVSRAETWLDEMNQKEKGEFLYKH